jgi:hypothetical protein
VEFLPAALAPKVGLSKRASNRSIEVSLYLWLAVAEVNNRSPPLRTWRLLTHRGSDAEPPATALDRVLVWAPTFFILTVWAPTWAGQLDGPNSDPIDTSFFLGTNWYFI